MLPIAYMMAALHLQTAFTFGLQTPYAGPLSFAFVCVGMLASYCFQVGREQHRRIEALEQTVAKQQELLATLAQKAGLQVSDGPGQPEQK